MSKEEQPIITFTMTLDQLLALRQSLENLEQTIMRDYEVQMRSIDLLEKWAKEPIVYSQCSEEV